MSTKYKSKIGVEIVIPLIIIFSAVIFLAKDGYSIWTVLAISPAILFIIYLFQNTYYIITDTTLKVKSGFLVNMDIDINRITQINGTNNMLSAPALSLDRLKITFSNSKSVLVSPNDKEKFIEHLKQINPQILIT